MQSDKEHLVRIDRFIKQNFDFDQWHSLYKNNPKLFEEKRKQLINQYVSLSPEEYQPRLKKLVSQVDKVRDKSSSPDKAFTEILLMMQNSVSDLHYFLNDLSYTLKKGFDKQ